MRRETVVQAAKRAKSRRKQESPRPRPAWPANWLAFTVVVLAFTIAAILHVRSKLAVVQLGYSLSEATREHKRLLAEQRELQVEVATLKNPRRLRELAIRKLGFREPAPGQIVRSRPGRKRGSEGKSRGKVALMEP